MFGHCVVGWSDTFAKEPCCQPEVVLHVMLISSRSCELKSYQLCQRSLVVHPFTDPVQGIIYTSWRKIWKCALLDVNGKQDILTHHFMHTIIWKMCKAVRFIMCLGFIMRDGPIPLIKKPLSARARHIRQGERMKYKLLCSQKAQGPQNGPIA